VGWCAVGKFWLFYIFSAVAGRGCKNGKVPKCAAGCVGLECLMFALSFVFCRQRVSGNDLRANEGRETKALNCKPNTNLKEISELSNYSKTSGFRLHAVISCGAT
jgi:hypothetical protein